MAEVLDAKVEKYPDLWHSMSALRIDGRKWHRLAHMAPNRHRLQAPISYRVAGDQLSQADDASARDREAERCFGAIDLNPALDVDGSLSERPTMRRGGYLKYNAGMVAKLRWRSRSSTLLQVRR